MKRIFLVLFVMGMVMCSVVFQGCAQEYKEAQAAALGWLKLVDAGDYAGAWMAASGYLKGAVAKEQLAASLTGVRMPLGAVIERSLKSKTYHTSLPGAPDGEYVVIQYETSFANKKNAVETVTPMKDSDNVWRVSGYYIK